jgi:hypothetical protein
MEYPRYNGHYIGIVVQNNDPQYRGRVKVFVPHISPTVYKGWNDSNADKNFNFIGSLTTNDVRGLTIDPNSQEGVNSSGSLTSILDDLKKILPWAEMSAPLAGGGSSGRFNATTGYGSISDSSNIDYAQASQPTEYSLNADNIGEKPGAVYDSAINKLSDAFHNPQLTNVNNVNKLSYDYVPETYSNSAKGAFPVLNVGAHVWVFFNEGDPLRPVVFGLSYGSNDWSTIFDASSGNPGTDYPGTYENIKKDSVDDINVRTYRNKYVINQKGGTLSFVNTDNKEVLKLTHFSGSFKEFNNLANIELATNNDQKLVLGDSFNTIRGNRNEYTQCDYDNVVAGDHYRKVGNLRHDLYEQWKGLMEAEQIPDIKQLFHIQRTKGATGIPQSIASLVKVSSKLQKKNGTPYLCPLCSASKENIIALNNAFGTMFDIITPTPGYASNADGNRLLGFGFGITGLLPGIASSFNPLTLLTGIPPIPQLIKNGGSVTDFQGGMLSLAHGTLGNGFPCPVCNPSSPQNVNISKNPDIVLKAGFSPSSFHGSWAKEPLKAELPLRYSRVLPKLAKLEAEMGIGGSEIVEITKHKIETIGMVMNDWGSIRLDPVGKMQPAFVDVSPYFPVTVSRPTPLIEQVQVDDLPGGTYTLNVCNKYNILVGAGGVNLKSYGVINIAGAMTNITGEQVNVSSANEVNIDGGKRLSLTGDIVHIKQRYGEQVLLDSSVGITGNLIVKGGIFVEGNLSTLSTTTTQIKRKTDETQVSGRAQPTTTTGMGIPMDSAGTIDPLSLQVIPDPKGTIPVYMGYTDPNAYIGWVPAGTAIGSISIESIGVNLPITSSGFAVVGTGPNNLIPGMMTELQLLPAPSMNTYSTSIYGKLPPTGYVIPPGTPDAALEATPEMRQVTLRGLPPDKVQELKLKLETPGAGDQIAIYCPVLNVGAGSHPDSHIMAPHSHSHNEGDMPTHAMVRTDFASNAIKGNVPTKSEYHGQAPEKAVKFVKMLESLLGGIKI